MKLGVFKEHKVFYDYLVTKDGDEYENVFVLSQGYLDEFMPKRQVIGKTSDGFLIVRATELEKTKNIFTN